LQGKAGGWMENHFLCMAIEKNLLTEKELHAIHRNSE